jgi:hypothetical protein
MTKYLVVAGPPKQFEYHGPFDDLDAAYTHGAQLGRDDWQVGDVQADGVHLRFRWSRDRAVAQTLKMAPLPSDEESNVDLAPDLARFLRDGTCRR